MGLLQARYNLFKKMAEIEKTIINILDDYDKECGLRDKEYLEIFKKKTSYTLNELISLVYGKPDENR